MSETERRMKYYGERVLIDTGRILDPQFDDTVIAVTGAHLELMRNLMMYLNRRNTFVSSYGYVNYLTPTDADWNSIRAIVASLEEILMGNGAGGITMDYVCVRHKENQGVQSGTLLSGSWRTRVVNQEQADESNICSLDSNQITLDAGEYICDILANGHDINMNQLRLWSITDSIVLLIGHSAYTPVNYPNAPTATIAGRFVLGDTKTLEVQHRCNTTKNNYGMGYPCNFTDEIYLTAQFWRLT